MKNRTDEIKKDSLARKLIFSGGETVNAMKISYLADLAFGGIGRIPNAGILEWVPIFPPAVDILSDEGITLDRTGRYIAYCLGVATVYADKVYPAVREFADRF